MVRLFVAAWPPDPVRAWLAAKDRPAVPGVRWTTADQWHVTLRFLGDVEGDDRGTGAVADLIRALDGLPASGVHAAPASVRVGVVRFGRAAVGLPVAGLDALAGAVVTATARFGLVPDGRPFRGHLTVARGDARAASRAVRITGTPPPWTADAVALVRSHLGAGPARYETLHTVVLPRAQTDSTA
jgi:2'-5' RNA ligase